MNLYIEYCFIGFCAIFFLLNCCCRAQKLNDVYNLNFEYSIDRLSMFNTWKVSGCLSHQVKLDSLNVYDGKSSTKIIVTCTNIQPGGGLQINQLLTIPPKVNNVEISFWTKSEKLSQGMFNIVVLDSLEQIIIKEELSFQQSSSWSRISCKFENKLGRLMHLEFEIGANSIIWLDNLELLLNGIDYYKFNEQHEKIIQDSDFLTNRNILTKMIDFNFTRIINDLRLKKIIGIGESSHGNHEIGEFRNKLTKELISKEKCRLVILEAPEMFAEHLNKYIHGDLNEVELFKRNDQVGVQYFNLTEEIFDLLKWIKKYNETTKHKVNIAGMDVSHEWSLPLRRVINGIQNKSYRKQINNYMNLSRPDSIITFMKTNEIKIVSEISKNRFDSICEMAIKYQRFISVYSSFSNDKVRDSIMALNVLEFTNKFNKEGEKVVVFGHLAHLNKQKIDNSISSSVGNYLSKNLGSNYFVLGLLVATGEFQAYQIDNKKLNIQPLISSASGSIEYYCNKLTNKQFYLNLHKEPLFFNRIMLYRFVGGIPRKQQFFPGNPALRFDGIIFMPIGSPSHLLPIYNAAKK